MVQLGDTPDCNPVSIVETQLIVLVRIQPRALKNCNDYKWLIHFCDELAISYSAICRCQYPVKSTDLPRFIASAAMRFRDRRYSVFFEVRADLAWVARSMSGGGCCSPAIAHQTPT